MHGSAANPLRLPARLAAAVPDSLSRASPGTNGAVQPAYPPRPRSTGVPQTVR